MEIRSALPMKNMNSGFTKMQKYMKTDDINKIMLCILFFVAVIVELFCFSQGISGNDFWWHLKVGEWICSNHRIPTTDIFSWLGTELEISWTAHEWLSDVIYYSIHHLFGELGIYLFCLLAALLMTFLMFWQVRHDLKENLLIGSVFFILFVVVSSGFFYGRPHLFSFFLLFWELKILYGFTENPQIKTIYLLPVIGCLWSNLHGGSSNLAYLLCLMFFLFSFFRVWIGRAVSEPLERTARWKLGIVTLGTFLSLLLNPVGIRVVLYPYQSLADSLMMSVISEWQAPDAKNIGSLFLFFFPMFLMTIGFLTEQREIRLIDLAIMGIFFYLFFRSARFIILWYIAACFYAFPYMPRCGVKEIKKQYEKVILYGCAALLLLPLGMGIWNIVTLGKGDGYISQVMSPEAVHAVQSANPSRIFNDYNLGEILIYNDIPVFFDARADLYSQEHIMEDGISLMNLVQKNVDRGISYVDVEAMMEQYAFDGILILKSRSLYAWLIAQQEKYTCIYEDDSVAYFCIGNMVSDM